VLFGRVISCREVTVYCHCPTSYCHWTVTVCSFNPPFLRTLMGGGLVVPTRVRNLKTGEGLGDEGAGLFLHYDPPTQALGGRTIGEP